MENLLKKIEEYPDISFIDGASFSSVQERMIENYEKRYKELTGKDASLALADPVRLILYSCAVEIYQGYQYEDRAGKMGLLKYSTGDFLDHLAALKGVIRNEAAPAETTIRFTLAAAISKDVMIPAGVRIKGLDLYFETSESGMIRAGEISVDVTAKCQTAGKVGNDFRPGEIQTLVDPLPYTLKAENVTISSGGRDREEDKELAERVYLAPSSFSTAGPAPSYEYWVKTYSHEIEECRIVSESPGEVDIYVMTSDGIPTDEFVEGLKKYLDQSKIRPLTDYVVVKKPEKIDYDIELIYYINGADKDMEESLKAAADLACKSYMDWQQCLGRDITPSRLIYELMKAGVQSVEVKKPVYQEVKQNQIAIAGDPVIEYGGLRDD